MSLFRDSVSVSGHSVGARVRNTVPGDFAADGTVIEILGTRDVRVLWDDEDAPESNDRGWWVIGKNVEHIR